MSRIQPPVYCNLELTNDCNLRCRICANRLMERPRGFMNDKTIDESISQILEAKIKKVNLTTIGEPSLHSKLGITIRKLKSQKLYVLLNTNLQALDEGKINELLDSELDLLSISIEGVDFKTYESTRINGSFEKLLCNLNILRALRSKNPKTEVVFRSVVSKNNTENIEVFKNFWKHYADRFEFPTMGNQGGYLPVKNCAWMSENRIPCRLLWNSITITLEGHISYCCIDFDNEMIIGNIWRERLSEVWQDEGYRILRENHLKLNFDNLKHCKICSSTFEHWKYFPTIYKRD